MSEAVIPRVIVKFSDDLELPDRDEVEDDPEQRVLRPWKSLRERFPGITLKRVFTGPTADGLRELTERASLTDPSFRPRALLNYYAVDCPPGVDAEDVAAEVSSWPGVETAYVESGPVPPPGVNPDDDPRRPNQGYLDPAPTGIDAEYAWQFAGGDGEGIRFVDLEQGWTLDHEDLIAAEITLISGLNRNYFGHGTAVLGMVVASDNKVGCVGIAPGAKGRVVSQYRTPSVYNTAAAIADALSVLRFGDVLLLEAQAQAPDYSLLPVETEGIVFDTIRLGTAAGVTIIEAAGNGSVDLDNYTGPNGKRVLSRNSNDFRDSGAVVVGAAGSANPHGRLPISNYGSRVDCYAWGQHIDTAGDGKSGTSTAAYTKWFGGTSGATAIIAGAAVAVQGIRAARIGEPFRPPELRAILSDAASGTASADPAHDRIGVMPNLRAIINQAL